MSQRSSVSRQHLAAPPDHRTPRPWRRPTTPGRALVMAGTAVLTGAAVIGCTPDSSEQGRAEPATPTAGADAPPLLAEQPPETPLAPGRYVAHPFDSPPDAPFAPVLSIPSGFLPIDGAGVHADQFFPSVVWLWDIDSVYTHPCDADSHPAPVGPSVADLAAALAAQPMRDGTAPVPVTIGGFEGLYVELSTPTDLDFATCREGYFYSWPGRGDRVAGLVDRLWIMDVEGQRITFDLSHPPATTPEIVDQLEEIVTRATFIQRQGT